MLVVVLLFWPARRCVIEVDLLDHCGQAQIKQTETNFYETCWPVLIDHRSSRLGNLKGKSKSTTRPKLIPSLIENYQVLLAAHIASIKLIWFRSHRVRVRKWWWWERQAERLHPNSRRISPSSQRQTHNHWLTTSWPTRCQFFVRLRKVHSRESPKSLEETATRCPKRRQRKRMAKHNERVPNISNREEVKITKEPEKTNKTTRQNDQSDKFYTLAEKIGFKQSNFSIDQSIKSIINA